MVGIRGQVSASVHGRVSLVPLLRTCSGGRCPLSWVVGFRSLLSWPGACRYVLEWMGRTEREGPPEKVRSLRRTLTMERRRSKSGGEGWCSERNCCLSLCCRWRSPYPWMRLPLATWIYFKESIDNPVIVVLLYVQFGFLACVMFAFLCSVCLFILCDVCACVDSFNLLSRPHFTLFF